MSYLHTGVYRAISLHEVTQEGRTLREEKRVTNLSLSDIQSLRRGEIDSKIDLTETINKVKGKSGNSERSQKEMYGQLHQMLLKFK